MQIFRKNLTEIIINYRNLQFTNYTNFWWVSKNFKKKCEKILEKFLKITRQVNEILLRIIEKTIEEKIFKSLWDFGKKICLKLKNNIINM